MSLKEVACPPARSTGARLAAIGCGAAVLLALVSGAHALSAQELRRIEDASTVDITTTGRKSGLPRTVTIWFVLDGGRPYIQSGEDGKTHWYRNLQKTPELTMDFGGLVVRGRARFIDDAAEAEHVHGLFRSKYLTARVMSWFGGGFGQGKVVLIEALEAVPGRDEGSS